MPDKTITTMRAEAAALPPLELCERLDKFSTTMLREGMGNWEAILIHEAVLRLTETMHFQPATPKLDWDDNEGEAERTLRPEGWRIVDSTANRNYSVYNDGEYVHGGFVTREAAQAYIDQQ